MQNTEKVGGVTGSGTSPGEKRKAVNGMNKRLALWMLPVLALMLFTACSGSVETGQALLQAPMAAQQQTELLQTVTEYLGENVTLKYPMSRADSSPFLWWDADGDGVQELVVLYQNTVKSKNVQLAVLRQGADGWYAAHMDVEGAAGEVDGLRSVLLSDGREYLVAGYQEPSSKDQTVCLYQWSGGALRERARLTCQKYVMQDLEGDDVQELILIQKHATYGNLQLRVYDAEDPVKQKENGLLTERFVTLLDSRFDRCLSMEIGPTAEGGLVLVMDFEDGYDKRMAEVMLYQGDRFIRCYVEESGNVPNFTARPFACLSPTDLDRDGFLEVPRVSSSVLDSGQEARFHFVGWYHVTLDGAGLCGFSLVDTKEECQLLLPVEWHGQVLLQADVSGQWSVRSIATGERLFRIGFAQESLGSGYRLLGDLGEKRVYLQFSAELPEEQMEQILSGLRLLYI